MPIASGNASVSRFTAGSWCDLSIVLILIFPPRTLHSCEPEASVSWARISAYSSKVTLSPIERADTSSSAREGQRAPQTLADSTIDVAGPLHRELTMKLPGRALNVVGVESAETTVVPDAVHDGRFQAWIRRLCSSRPSSEE
eukprot:scaffold420_cov404-Prasinococcus_capsulatus_cf.AAC.18